MSHKNKSEEFFSPHHKIRVDYNRLGYTAQVLRKKCNSPNFIPYFKKPKKMCKSKNSWDTLWEWQWFTRETWMEKYWIETERAVKPLLKILQKLNVEYLLDASCGLGFKTILFAKQVIR